MISHYFNKHCILGAAFAVAALCVRLWLFSYPQIDIETVLNGLYKLETMYLPFPRPQSGPLVMVGFGGCTDITVNAVTFLKSLGVNSNSKAKDFHHAPDSSFELNDLEDVVTEFTEMFAAGAAAERYVKNQTLFDLLVRQASSNVVNPNQLRETAERGFLSLGGNAPVMATRLAREGAEVTLVARVSPLVAQTLPPSIRILAAPASFGLPETPKMDVHLVLEFDKGMVWRNLTAPRANRYILIRDEENPRLSSLWPDLMPSWHKRGNHGRDSVKDASFPDLFVIGGLQTMDNAVISPDVRGERMGALKHFLSTELPRSTLVHFEMASFVEAAFAANLTRTLLPYVDSVGLNEQELPNLRSLLSEGVVAREASTSIPRAALMLDEMREIWSLLTHPTQLPRIGTGLRRFSRLHLHTLGYQIIMVRRPNASSNADAMTVNSDDQKDTEQGVLWPFTRAAAAKASLIAHRHTCATASIDPELTRLLMDDSFAITANPSRWSSVLVDGAVPRIQFDPSTPVSCWFEPEPVPSTEGGGFKGSLSTKVEICVAPVPVCRRVTRTVGGGDNISAAALRMQLVELKRRVG